jgi:hypothetical protein
MFVIPNIQQPIGGLVGADVVVDVEVEEEVDDDVGGCVAVVVVDEVVVVVVPPAWSQSRNRETPLRPLNTQSQLSRHKQPPN